VERIAAAPFTRADGFEGRADTTLYTAPSGARVFAAGSLQLGWGLGDEGVPPHSARSSTAARALIARLFDLLSE
jgi:hypothetical protein